MNIVADRIVLVALGVAAAALMFNLFFTRAYAQPVVSDSAYAPAAYAGPPKGPAGAPVRAPMLEVHIANNGLVLVRGARVVAIRGTRLTIQLGWGATSLTWVVEGGSGTRYFNSDGTKAAAVEVKVGDSISVSGMLSASDSNPTIEAEFVRRQ